jgi:hypothetical protein
MGKRRDPRLPAGVTDRAGMAAIRLGELLASYVPADKADEVRLAVEELVSAVHDDAYMPRLAIASLLGGIVDAAKKTARRA